MHKLNLPQKNINPEAKYNYARKIVALAGSDNFDEMQKDSDFAEIYDLAVRYLDQELANEKDSNWEKLVQLILAYSNK